MENSKYLKLQPFFEFICRTSNTGKLGLDKAGVDMDGKGDIIVDDFQNTSNPK